MKESWFSFAVLILDFYSTFVLKNLWNWFAVPALGVPVISYWGMYGLVLLIRSISATGPNIEQDRRWKTIFAALDFCLPQDRIDEIKEMIKDQVGEIWTDIGIAMFARLGGTTFALAVGWGVHTFFL